MEIKNEEYFDSSRNHGGIVRQGQETIEDD